jgi:hypothetical protein
VAQRKTLTEAQLDLLQRIADGPPEKGVMGNSERVSAAALWRRGLVTTFGRAGGTWREVEHDCPSKARDSGVVFAAWTQATTLPRRSPIRVGH